MCPRKYEVHNLADRALPLIFHHFRMHTTGPFSTDVGNWHENVELLYFLGGEGQICCGGGAYTVGPGDMLIVNSHELHGFFSRSGMEYYCLIVDSSFLTANALPVEDICFETFVRSETVSQLYLDVVHELEGSGPYQSLVIRAKILLLMADLAKNHACPEKRRFAADENVKLAIGYIKANFSKRITLEDIAGEVGLNKCYLAREFKKATGMTLISYLNMVRCENAKKMILKGNCTISEAAHCCGFENNSYFSRAFRSITGVLPSEVRACQEDSSLPRFPMGEQDKRFSHNVGKNN